MLLELQYNYQIQFSANDETIKECFVSDTSFYKTSDELLNAILPQCQLEYKKIDGVFVIKKIENVTKKNEKNLFKIAVLDYKTKEPLPFSSLQANANSFSTGESGFSHIYTSENKLSIKAQYLGYISVDTTVYFQKDIIPLHLKPKSISLKEFTVIADTIDYQTINLQGGEISINPEVVDFLPGTRSNSIFSLMRLQPGIQASGEQANNFLIWGASQGESHLIVDGFTLFKSSSSNDNIGVINPLLIKNMNIFKGGYQVNIGDRVGSTVSITTKTGNLKKFTGEINVSNEIISSNFNIPIFKRSVLQLGVRRSHFDLLGTEKLFRGVPEITRFRDLNLKHSIYLKNNDLLQISLLNSVDNEHILNNRFESKNDISLDKRTDSKQYGGSIVYTKNWKKNGISTFSLVSSGLNSDYTNSGKNIVIDKKLLNNRVENGVSETKLMLEHESIVKKYVQIKYGLLFINNKTSYAIDSNSTSIKRDSEQLFRTQNYVLANWKLSKNINLETGIKNDYIPETNDIYFQPRLALNWKKRNNSISLKAGNYKQFITENSLIDEYGNAIYFWSSTTKPISANHFVLSYGYSKKRLEFKTEFFHKQFWNQSRYLTNPISKEIQQVPLRTKASGMDIFLKYNLHNHNFWVGYSLGKIEESINNTPYRISAKDQRHEIKTATIFNFNKWGFSSNYVFGSGLPNRNKERFFYSRLDIAITKKINRQKINYEYGASILNLLNTKNRSYSDFVYFGPETKIHQIGTAFTPSVFINLKF